MITLASKYGSAREQARRSTPAQNNVDALAERFERFLPGMASRMAVSRAESLGVELPDGASWDTRRTAMIGGTSLSTNGANGTMTSTQRPYMPEFDSPDRQNYPVHRLLANRYWRMFYKLDPVIGTCTDLIAEMPWSNFELTGDGVEGDIRDTYEVMCEKTQLLGHLPYFIREYLSVGEVVPHLFFSEDEGIWTHIALHNPDQLEVVNSPFLRMDPIIVYNPDDRLRSVLNSPHPAMQQIRESMPPDLLARIEAREGITLSPLNATFIARKLHPYDARGTSIYSRLWRILMYEDAVFNASIQTARRHAGPLKVAKLGNAQTGWIPGPEHERRLLELLAQAEVDPNAWLVYHFGIAFDLVGTTDRIMNIGKEWDVIERIKLVALGISKSFLHGEVTYASAATGLQVFLQRLKSMRSFFETTWLYPKFFRPVAMMNNWVRPKQSEVAHRFRVKRSPRELMEDNRYIIPKIVWDRKLDSSINMEVINAMQALEGLGVKFSKTTKMATTGHSYEEETRKIHREIEFEKQFLPDLTKAGQGAGAGGAGGALPGGVLPPSMPGDAGGMPGGDMGGMPGGDPAAADPAAGGMPTGDAGIPAVGAGRMAKAAGKAKRQTTINGVTFKIEYDAGDTRSGKDMDGRKWSRKMHCAYGYVPKTSGDDGECVDVYVNEDGKFDKVYVVHQRKKDGSYDEDKCMVGWPSKEAAKAAFLKCMPKWALGPITIMRWDEWKDKYLGTRKRASTENSPKPGKPDSEYLESEIWVNGKYKNWDADEVESLIELVRTGDTDSPFWSKILRCSCNGPHRQTCLRKATLAAMHDEDWDVLWELISHYLDEHGYPDDDIAALREILVAEGLLSSDDGAADSGDAAILDMLEAEAGEDLFVGFGR